MRPRRRALLGPLPSSTPRGAGPRRRRANAPAIGRARIEVWDDRGHRYRVTPVQGASRGVWSEVAAEIVPAIAPDAGALAMRVSDLPLGAGSGRRTRRSRAVHVRHQAAAE